MPLVRSFCYPTLYYPKTEFYKERSKPHFTKPKRNLTIMPGSKTYSN